MSVLGALGDASAFLTRVPLPERRDFDLALAAWAFPVVGAVTGLLLGVAGAVASGRLGWFVAAVVVVLLEVLLTGALHLDGLADCADGTGGRDRRARLRIMKDHAVGVYGTAAVVLDLLLKVALLAGLLATGSTALVVTVTTIVWTLSRTAMLPLAAWLPYAREEGTGRALVDGLTTGRVGAAGLVAAVVVGGATWAGVALTGRGLGLAVLGPVATVAGVTLLTARWARRTLGGVTGDVLGATAEVTLLTALLTALLLLG